MTKKSKSKQKRAAELPQTDSKDTTTINSPSPFTKSGNNIILVANNFECPEEMPPSCVDNSNFGNLNYNSTTPPVSEENYILGLDLEPEYDDDDDTTHKTGSWCLASNATPPTTASSTDNDCSSTADIRTGNGGDADSFITPVITSIRSLNLNHSSLSYQTACGFEIGPQSSTCTSYNNTNNSTKRMKSPDSESSSTCGSVPPFTSCSTVWDELRHCELTTCNAAANKKCGQCKSAYYCCEDHQRDDWQRHKNSCTSYRIQDVGYGADYELPVCAAVACRNIPAGQIIFSEKAMLVFPMAESKSDNQFSHVMNLGCVKERTRRNNSNNCELFCESTAPACLGCMKVVEFIGPSRFKCNKCRLPICSYNCQFLTSHQAGECEAISVLNLSRDEISGGCHHTLYMDVEILRALQLEAYNNNQWERFLEMKNNVRVEAYKKTAMFKLFAQNIKALVPFSAKMSGYNYDLIMDVHAIITSLSFRPALTSSFKLLFNLQPQFAHHCVPNTLQFIEDEHTGDQDRMRLVTKAACAIIKTEIITVDFTPSPYLPYPRRHQILTDLLSITNCLCERCQNPSLLNDITSEIKCPMCRCGTVFPETPTIWQDSVWSCRKCQEEISFSRIQSIENECQIELRGLINKPKDTIVTLLVDFIHRKGELELNPTHHIILQAWCYVESNLRNQLKSVRKPDPSVVYTDAQIDSFRVLKWYTEVMEPHLECIRPGMWIDKGIVLFHKFYSTFVQESRDYQEDKMSRKEFVQAVVKSMKILQKSLQILSVYEGYNAPSVCQLTQEATSALASLKEYIQFLLTHKEDAPLPKLAQVLAR